MARQTASARRRRSWSRLGRWPIGTTTATGRSGRAASHPRWRRAAAIALVVALAALLWLAATDDVRVWPVRNTLQYHAYQWWWARVGPPGGPDPSGRAARGAPPGALWGTVRDARGRPIGGARVLLTRWDGTTHSAASGPDGGYLIRDVPAGRLGGVAGAPGHADVVLRDGGQAPPGWLPWPAWELPWPAQFVTIRAGTETRLDPVLPAGGGPPPVAPGRRLQVGAPEPIACRSPLESQATRRRLTFDSGGRPNQPTFLYTPATAEGRWPALLTVYPGPADEWECASVPLAAAGYAVVAAGPAYSFELERDVDELVRLLTFARAGQLPGADGTRIAVLGGSFSALHVQRLLAREAHEAGVARQVQGVVLLGAPTDLFDVRRRFDQGTFVPPFGLDQALIALGFPDREPLRYWRYSGAYQVRPNLPPMMLVHSRSDDVVPYQQSELLAVALASAGVPHELHLIEGASHYLLSEEGDTLAIYRLTLEFLAARLT